MEGRGCHRVLRLTTTDPQPYILPSYALGLDRGECRTPVPSVPPAPLPCPSGWLGPQAVPAAARSREGRCGAGVGMGAQQDSPRPAALPPPAGARATRGLPSPRPETEGRGQRGWAPVTEGSVPGLARRQLSERRPTPHHPRQGRLLSPGGDQRRDSVRSRAHGGAGRERRGDQAAGTRGAACRGAPGGAVGAGLTRPGCRRCRSRTC